MFAALSETDINSFSDIAGFVKEKVSKYWEASCPGVELKQFLDMDSHEFTDTQDLQGLTGKTKVFVLFLTHDRTAAPELKAGVAMRWFVIADELMTAVKLKKPILLIRDTDERPGRFGGSMESFQQLYTESSVVAEVSGCHTYLN